MHVAPAWNTGAVFAKAIFYLSNFFRELAIPIAQGNEYHQRLYKQPQPVFCGHGLLLLVAFSILFRK